MSRMRRETNRSALSVVFVAVREIPDSCRNFAAVKHAENTGQPQACGKHPATQARRGVDRGAEPAKGTRGVWREVCEARLPR